MRFQTISDWMRHVFYGMCMGAADLVPGVSGGTMALICGIYESLIHAIKSFSPANIFSFKNFNQKVAWDFLLAILIGIGFSFILFSHSIHYMMNQEGLRVYLYAFFFGMILSSIVFCGWRVPNWSNRLLWGVAAGAAISLFVTGFSPEPLVNGKEFEVTLPIGFQYRGEKIVENYSAKTGVLKGVSKNTLAAMWAKGSVDGATSVFDVTNNITGVVSDFVKPAPSKWLNPWLIFCGAIAVTAMLLPGISGSYLLMILGIYPVVIAALVDLVKGLGGFTFDPDAVLVLGNLAIGIVLGALLFSRVIDWFLKKDHDMTMATLIGLMIGAMRVVWPFWTYTYRMDPLNLLKGPHLIGLETFTPPFFSIIYWSAALTALLGFALVFLLSRLAKDS